MAKILMIDDDVDILTFGRKILSSAGHDVLVANNVLEALDILHLQQCDMVISDANMPLHSGFDLLKTLKSEERFKRIPVALLTARKDREDESAIRLGADDYIVKPIDSSLLIRKVDTLLKKLPPKPRLAVGFQEVETRTKAQIRIEAHILSVSEVGIVIESPQALSEGQSIQLNTTLFDAIGLTPPPMLRTLSCETSVDLRKWRARLIFVGATDAALQKIRAWINAEIIRQRAKVLEEDL